MSKQEDAEFMKSLEDGVRTVLADKKSTAKEKIEAITAGAKLMQIKHKISDSGDSSGSFFNK